MKIVYDNNNQPRQPRVYLATPDKRILCVLNGIDEPSFSLVRNLNNTCEISFDVRQFVTFDGEQIPSNGYEWLTVLMKIKVDGIGWFILNPPSTSNDGIMEVKHVTAESCEIEFQQHDIKGIKINRGTTDSYEIASVPDNVGYYGETEYALEQIKFYNAENEDLSLLHILLKICDIGDWTIGYIDNIPKKYEEYQDDGSIAEKYVLLKDEIGSFEIDSQDLYSFLTQDVSQYFSCIFKFDIENNIINAYRVENIGKDTNININFRNVENSNEVSIDEENLFTRFFVQGSDELSIQYVNFGLNYIENLDYFLNEKYLKRSVIDKYKLWRSDLETARTSYIDYTRQYNEKIKVRDELVNRLPLDGCSTDWSTFTDEELLDAKESYTAQKEGYEYFYDDDMEALEASVDALDYHQIVDVILPSIDIEIENREIPTEEKEPYIDTYKTNWNLYGLDELRNSLRVYQNTVDSCTENGYNVPWDAESDHSKEFHDTMYEKYLQAAHQLDETYTGDEGTAPVEYNDDDDEHGIVDSAVVGTDTVGSEGVKHSCQWFFNLRQAEYDAVCAELDDINEQRKNLGDVADKTQWEHDNGDGTTTSFTTEDIFSIARLYIDGDYVNENILITAIDDQVTSINSQLQLYEDAVEQLSIASQPQCSYATSLDNFLSDYGYDDYIKELNEGDFLYFGVREDYVVKLRVMSIEYNPLVMDNNLNITFSNMLRGRSGRNDFSYLLGASNGAGKNTVSGGSSSSSSDKTSVEITTSLLNHIVNSPAFTSQVNNIVENNYGGYISTGGSISVEELNAKMIEVTDIRGQNAFFDYIQSEFIATNQIVAQSASFQAVDALAANIDSLLTGTTVAELGHIINLTAQNVSIDQAVIRDLIAAQMTVAMLQAGDISTDTFRVVSDDGGLVIDGNTMQFYDSDENIRIQIGRDANDDFTFTLYDADGQGILIDEEGIHASAIADGLIVNDMIGNGEIGREKLSFYTVEADANGNVSASKVMINGQGLDVAYTNITNSITEIEEDLENAIVYDVEIWSSNGNFFKNGAVSTVLSAHVFHGNEDITNDINASRFHWIKRNNDGSLDTAWNTAHAGGTKSITITADMVSSRATFECSVDGLGE